MDLIQLVVFWLFAVTSARAQDVVLYDAYFGKPLSDKRNTYLMGVASGSGTPLDRVRALGVPMNTGTGPGVGPGMVQANGFNVPGGPLGMTAGLPAGAPAGSMGGAPPGALVALLGMNAGGVPGPFPAGGLPVLGGGMNGVSGASQNANGLNIVPLPSAEIGANGTDIAGVDVTSILNLCTIPVRACRKYEGRRVDGTCTNPKYPSRGAGKSPLPRLLPAKFGPGNSLRSAQDGSPLPSTRHIRTTLLGDGHFRDKEFSALANDVFVFSFVDNVDLFYLIRYNTVSDCCINNQIPNTADPRCIPITVQQDDPFLRRTSVRCLNLTRVETYQDFGCIPNSLPAERYSRVPPLLDLSTVYGNTEERSRAIRANRGGLLAFRMEEGREVPAGLSPFCLNNKPDDLEISCYDYGDNFDGNLLQGIYLTAMWFFREHNRIARHLASINPCWDDQKLFETARQINIAQWQFIFFYELIPEFIGYKNALDSGIIYDTKGYVNDFDPKCEPGVYHEYVVGCRWFHTFQTGVADLYRDGKYVGSRTVVDDELRSGILAINNTEADLTFRDLVQPADKFDYVLDPDLGNRIFGEAQTASDVGATDMMRGRDAGLPSYNEYRKFCGMKYAHNFEDFYDAIDKDKVEFLSRLYDDVDDVDLMAAIYVERLIPGGYVGPTLYCIMVHNYQLWRRSDKFFFEHGGFPAALTEYQLKEVKSTSIARVLCDNGVSVKNIQPKAFLRRSHWNEFMPCEKISGINLKAWTDHECLEDDDKKKKK